MDKYTQKRLYRVSLLERVGGMRIKGDLNVC